MAKYSFIPPKGLHPKAEDYIKKVVEYLDSNNQIDEVDDAALTMLAINYSLFLNAVEDINENGLTIQMGSRVVSNPSVKNAKECQVQAFKLLEKFGLTALDRKKLFKGDETDEDSPLIQFIKDSK
jgi:P27 family predicted phage terminase small subunit